MTVHSTSEATLKKPSGFYRGIAYIMAALLLGLAIWGYNTRDLKITDDSIDVTKTREIYLPSEVTGYGEHQFYNISPGVTFTVRLNPSEHISLFSVFGNNNPKNLNCEVADDRGSTDQIRPGTEFITAHIKGNEPFMLGIGRSPAYDVDFHQPNPVRVKILLTQLWHYALALVIFFAFVFGASKIGPGFWLLQITNINAGFVLMLVPSVIFGFLVVYSVKTEFSLGYAVLPCLVFTYFIYKIDDFGGKAERDVIVYDEINSEEVTGFEKGSNMFVLGWGIYSLKEHIASPDHEVFLASVT